MLNPFNFSFVLDAMDDGVKIKYQFDENDLKKLFDEFFESLCGFASSYVKDDAQVVDIVQDCFLKLWINRDDISHGENLKSYLYTTVRNSCINILKKQKYKREDLSVIQSEIYLENSLIRIETIRLFYQAIEKLPPQTREIIFLALDGLRNQEIAGKLNISENTVHALKKKAYKRLKTSLGSNYYLFIFFSMVR